MGAFSKRGCLAYKPETQASEPTGDTLARASGLYYFIERPRNDLGYLSSSFNGGRSFTTVSECVTVMPFSK